VQNPSNKKEILCDEVLEKLTGEKKFAGFGFAKFMKPHLDPQDQD
jgi:chromatin remodeling complex protein RSC6